MNITISLEELRAYQKACEEWVERTVRKEQFQHLLKEVEHQSFLGDIHIGSWLQQELGLINKYLKENEMPKLIPIV